MKELLTTSKSDLAKTNGSQINWVKRAGLYLLSCIGAAATMGSLVIPLSNLLIRPKLKRLHQLRSPLLARFLKQKGYDFAPISFSSYDNKRLHGWFLLKSLDNPTVIV